MSLTDEYGSDAPRLLRDLKTRPESHWIERGEVASLALFHAMAERVPAYKDFIKKNGVRAEAVKTMEDFRQLPKTNKENYLLSYPLEALCWDGAFREKQWMFSSTSGSTGEPYYFPRTREQDEQ